VDQISHSNGCPERSADQRGSDESVATLQSFVNTVRERFLSLAKMVRCFLIHTVCPVSALGSGESRVLYSRVFGPDEAAWSDRDRGLGPEERRLLQKEKIAVVARWVVFKRGLALCSRCTRFSKRLHFPWIPGSRQRCSSPRDSSLPF